VELRVASEHAEPSNWQAGALALLVHLGFFALLFFGFSWHRHEPEAVVAELWSSLPVSPPAGTPPPRVEPKPEPQKPAPRAEPKPPPRVESPKPDIALKAKPEEKKRPEPKPEPKQEPPKKAEKKPAPAPQPAVDREDLIQKQLDLLNKQAAAEQARQAAAANQSIIGDYKGRIKRKIRGFLNRQPCGDGNPELDFEIALLPTGQLRGNPVLRRGSGLPACDRAVENAILQSDPLPVPPQPEIFNEFRNLHLIIRPNDPND
jgi:colicin import membrane protein